jgi:hypothetical protein
VTVTGAITRWHPSPCQVHCTTPVQTHAILYYILLFYNEEYLTTCIDRFSNSQQCSFTKDLSSRMRCDKKSGMRLLIFPPTLTEEVVPCCGGPALCACSEVLAQPSAAYLYCGSAQWSSCKAVYCVAGATEPMQHNRVFSIMQPIFLWLPIGRSAM